MIKGSGPPIGQSEDRRKATAWEEKRVIKGRGC